MLVCDWAQSCGFHKYGIILLITCYFQKFLIIKLLKYFCLTNFFKILSDFVSVSSAGYE